MLHSPPHRLKEALRKRTAYRPIIIVAGSPHAVLIAHDENLSYVNTAFKNDALVVSPNTVGLRNCDMDRAICDRLVKKPKG